MEKIKESLKTLLHLGTHIKFITTVNYIYRDNNDYLNEIKLPDFYSKYSFTKAVNGNLQNYKVIIICSFLDELEKEFVPKKYPAYSERILKVKEVIKPIMKRIKKWKDLKNYRNYILAHNLREQKTSVFSGDRDKRTYQIPFSNSEDYLLSELIFLIIQIITSEFDEIVSEIDLSESLLDKVNFTQTDIDAQSEYDLIYSECISLIRK